MWGFKAILVYFNFKLSFLEDLILCIEYFVTRYFYAHNHIQDKQWYDTEFYSRMCDTTWLAIYTYLSEWLTVFIFKICSEPSICKLGTLLLYAIELYPHTNGDLSLLHVGEFMCMDGLWFYINYVRFFVYWRLQSQRKEGVILISKSWWSGIGGSLLYFY